VLPAAAIIYFSGFEHEAQRGATLIYFSRLEPRSPSGAPAAAIIYFSGFEEEAQRAATLIYFSRLEPRSPSGAPAATVIYFSGFEHEKGITRADKKAQANRRPLQYALSREPLVLARYPVAPHEGQFSGHQVVRLFR
jgi:hypothetical protein